MPASRSALAKASQIYEKSWSVITLPPALCPQKVQASFYFDTRIIEEAWIYRSNLKNHLRGTNVKPQRYSRSAGKVWNGSGRAPQLS